jgi:hypothetical protein
MSTKSTVFLSDDMETHVYVDVLDNMIHIDNGTGHVVMEPDLFRDIIAHEAEKSLRRVQYVAPRPPPRPTCVHCGLPDVGHFTPGPCQNFEAKP